MPNEVPIPVTGALKDREIQIAVADLADSKFSRTVATVEARGAIVEHRRKLPGEDVAYAFDSSPQPGPQRVIVVPHDAVDSTQPIDAARGVEIANPDLYSERLQGLDPAGRVIILGEIWSAVDGDFKLRI